MQMSTLSFELKFFLPVGVKKMLLTTLCFLHLVVAEKCSKPCGIGTLSDDIVWYLGYFQP